jgi:hypothetical protein
MIQVNLGEKYGIVNYEPRKQSPRERIANEKKVDAGTYRTEDDVKLFVKTLLKGNGDPAFTEDQLLDDGELFDTIQESLRVAIEEDFNERKKKSNMTP